MIVGNQDAGAIGHCLISAYRRKGTSSRIRGRTSFCPAPGFETLSKSFALIVHPNSCERGLASIRGSGVEDEPFLAPLTRFANWVFVVLNRERPQSKHTNTLGKARTPGWSREWKSRKWRFTSAVNSACRLDAHDGQYITAPSWNFG